VRERREEHLDADEEVLQPLRHVRCCVGGELLVDVDGAGGHQDVEGEALGWGLRGGGGGLGIWGSLWS